MNYVRGWLFCPTFFYIPLSGVDSNVKIAEFLYGIYHPGLTQMSVIRGWLVWCPGSYQPIRLQYFYTSARPLIINQSDCSQWSYMIFFSLIWCYFDMFTNICTEYTIYVPHFCTTLLKCTTCTTKCGTSCLLNFRNLVLIINFGWVGPFEQRVWGEADHASSMQIWWRHDNHARHATLYEFMRRF